MTDAERGADADPTVVPSKPPSEGRLAAARERNASVYPRVEQSHLRALADYSSASVIVGRDSLAGTGAGYRRATREADEAGERLCRAAARLVGALAATEGTLRELADATGVDVDDIARVLGRDKVTVLSKPGCVQCDATVRALTKKGVDFVQVDLADDAEALDLARGLGYMSAPVVVTPGGEHWAGFRPDRIADLDAGPGGEPPAAPAVVGPGQ
jgi:glutaredoxin-like protein NrdH